MAEDDDLDAELALFERQIQKVAAQASASPNPTDPHPPPVPIRSKPMQTASQSPQTSPPVPASLAAAVTTSAPAAAHVIHPTGPSLPAPRSESIPPATGGRWKWDGNAWRWRTNASTLASAQRQPPIVAPEQHVAPSQAKRVTTKRTAAGEVWQDLSLAEWPSLDHRIFVGDLAPDATDKHLIDTFSVYPSFNMARVVMDKSSGACRGYGFVSFADGRDMVRALRELNGKYISGRPVKLKRSNWQKRSLTGEKWKELKAFRSITKR